MIRIGVAFLRRDWMNLASYRFLAVMQTVGLLGFVGAVYSAGRLLGDSTRFQGGGLAYVSFLLSGIAFSDVLLTSMTAYSTALRNAQTTGTLETMMMAPIRPLQLVVSSTIFTLFRGLIRLVLVALVAVVGLGFWHGADIPAVVLLFVPAYACFVAVGLASAGFVVVLKQGDPVANLYGVLSAVVGGTFFPSTILPHWIAGPAAWLPLTSALVGIREALAGASPTQVAPQAASLWISAAVLLPPAVLFFRRAARRAIKEGSLVQY